MMSERFFGIISCAIIATAVVAQSLPACCKYFYTWPFSENPPQFCVDQYGKVCEDYGDGASVADPLARKTDGWRKAKCYTYTIANGSSFAQGPCSGGPPPGGVLVAKLPNSHLCCYYIQGTGPAPVETQRPFFIWKCDAPYSSTPN